MLRVWLCPLFVLVFARPLFPSPPEPTIIDFAAFGRRERISSTADGEGRGRSPPLPSDPWMDAEQNSTVSLPLRHRRLEKIGSDHSPTCKEITTTTTTVLMGQVSPRLEKDDDDSAEVTHACFFFSEKE